MKLAEIQHGTEFLSRTTLLHLLCSIIRCMFESIFNYCIFCLFVILVFTNYFRGSSTSTESILRSRAMMISGRLLSKENIYTFTDESSKTSSVSEVTEFFFLKKLQFCFYYPCPNLSRYVKRHGITTISFSS